MDAREFLAKYEALAKEHEIITRKYEHLKSVVEDFLEAEERGDIRLSRTISSTNSGADWVKILGCQVGKQYYRDIRSSLEKRNRRSW